MFASATQGGHKNIFKNKLLIHFYLVKLCHLQYQMDRQCVTSFSTHKRETTFYLQYTYILINTIKAIICKFYNYHYYCYYFQSLFNQHFSRSLVAGFPVREPVRQMTGFLTDWMSFPSSQHLTTKQFYN